MYREISIEEAIKDKKVTFVDVRSPHEYNEGTIPGAVNIPLFDDEERQRVGETYVQVSHYEGKMLGLEIVAPKLPLMVRKLSELASAGKVVVFCWRGGMRSRSVVQVCNMLGFDVLQLKGGYKAFRRYVLDGLERAKLPPNIFVLHGLTGAGKTEILQSLDKRGLAVLDLEELAKHRGSVFGQIGIEEKRGQKQFEAELFFAMEKLEDQPYFIVEAESRKIGECFLPEWLYLAMRKGNHILVNSSVEKRTERITKEYWENANVAPDEIEKSIKKLEGRLGKKKAEELLRLFAEGHIEEMVKILLLEYYDPLYNKSIKVVPEYGLIVNSDNMEAALDAITRYVETKGRRMQEIV